MLFTMKLLGSKLFAHVSIIYTTARHINVPLPTNRPTTTQSLDSAKTINSKLVGVRSIKPHAARQTQTHARTQNSTDPLRTTRTHVAVIY